MDKAARTVAFTDPNGQAVTVQTHTLEPHEVEAVEVRDLIVEEMDVLTSQAAMLVTPALHPTKTDPDFVEWFTCGAMQYEEIGSVGFYSIDPAVAEWALAVIESGKVW